MQGASIPQYAGQTRPTAGSARSDRLSHTAGLPQPSLLQLQMVTSLTIPNRQQVMPLPNMPTARNIRRSVLSPMWPTVNMPAAYAARNARSTWPSRDCRTQADEGMSIACLLGRDPSRPTHSYDEDTCVHTMGTTDVTMALDVCLLPTRMPQRTRIHCIVCCYGTMLTASHLPVWPVER